MTIVVDAISVRLDICHSLYNMNNQEKGKDFRRPLFEKEKKIFALFGEDFLKRKDEEINEILEKNPYNDI